MGAGTLQITKTLDAVGTLVKSIAAFGSTRVFQGKKRWDDATSFEEQIYALTAQSQGFFTYWLSGRNTGLRNHTTEATITAMAAFNLPKDTTTDENTLLENIEAVCDALTKESNFSTLGARVTSCGYERIEEDWVPQGIALFVMAFALQLGPFSGE